MEDFTQSQNDSLQSELFTKGFAAAAHEQTLGNSVSVQANPAIEFRVIRPGSPVRRLRLTGNRYTFGSGEGCSIRLEDETLRPMHAVLLRDAHRVLMRAYSVPLEHNGDRVTETDLRVGDIIRMGDYRFELLAKPTISGPGEPLRQRAVTPPTNRPTPSNDSLMRDRLAELSQQWHARHAECEIRETRCDNRESALHGRETELWRRANDLQKRESKLVAQEAAVREIQQTYAAAQNELKSLREREKAAEQELAYKEAELQDLQETLANRQLELQERQAEWQKREKEYAARAAEAQRQLEQTQSQAQNASEAITRMRNEFAALNEQLTELRERHSELQQREQDEQRTHDRLRAELELARNEAVIERDNAIEARAISEAAKAAKTTELEKAAAELTRTRAEIEDIRKESKARQQELEEKLQNSGQELVQARENAKAASQKSGQQIAEYRDQLAAAEAKESELEQSVSEFEALASEFQAELETARSEAAKDQEKARLECEETAAKIADLQQQLANLRQSSEGQQANTDQAISDLKIEVEDANQQRLAAEETATTLQSEIEQLQQRLSKSSEEVAKWQSEYEGATASIRQLELLVDQNQNSQSAQQDSWEIESDQLQNTINELSVQLSAANSELSKLREANEALTRELTEANDQREQTAAELIAPDRFAELENELKIARDDIERLKSDHAETIAQLETERQESESQLREEIQKLQDEITAAQQAATQASEYAASVMAGPQSLEHPLDSESSQPKTDESETTAASHADPTERLEVDAAESDDEPAASDWYSNQLETDGPAAETSSEHDEIETVDRHDISTDSSADEVVLLEEDTNAEEAWDEMQQHADSIVTAEAYQGEDTDSVINLDAVSISESLTQPSTPENVAVGHEADLPQHEPVAEIETATATDTEDEPAAESIDEANASGDNQWRADASAAESQAWPKSSAWGQVDPFESASDSSDPHAADNDAFDSDTNNTGSGSWASDEAENDASEAPQADATWSDESPEHAISNAIDDLEQRVQEAIDDQVDEPAAAPVNHWQEQPSEDASSATADSVDASESQLQPYANLPEREEPLSWADFMPGEDSQLTSSYETEESEQLQSDEDQYGDEAPYIENVSESAESLETQHTIGEEYESAEHDAVAYQSEEPQLDDPYADQQPIDPSSTAHDQSSEDTWQEETSPTEFVGDESPQAAYEDTAYESSDDDSYQATQVWQSDLESSVEHEPPAESEPTLGGLAEMLIRDLDAERDLERASVDQLAESNDEAEAEYEQTFVMEESVDDSESQTPWNFASSQSEYEQDEEESYSAEPVQELPPAPEATPAIDASTEDDSIEAYMNRLLQRVQGSNSKAPAEPAVATPAATAETTKPAPKPAKPETGKSIELADESDERSATGASTLAQEPSVSAPLVPRSQAPELKKNLSAMRELANQSARNAVARSIRIQARDTQMNAFWKAALAGSFILMAAGVFTFVSWSSTIKLVMVGAFVVLAGVFGQEAFVLARDARRRLKLANDGSNGLKDDEEIAEEMRRIAESAETPE
ncbi:hypothetical protein LOC67_01045 [Stieleria sp. JC731]|uniref:hypothetical protein n=1 Tax=Pirellulaceae TaxID=2691357 RepID=UPI001E3295EA|nr:hypothetical protein [Stieleria sp. JC731]MCC9599127.1 hypothetical protein [Stieleria sp. JC731]